MLQWEKLIQGMGRESLIFFHHNPCFFGKDSTFFPGTSENAKKLGINYPALAHEKYFLIPNYLFKIPLVHCNVRFMKMNIACSHQGAVHTTLKYVSPLSMPAHIRIQCTLYNSLGKQAMTPTCKGSGKLK